MGSFGFSAPTLWRVGRWLPAGPCVVSQLFLPAGVSAKQVFNVLMADSATFRFSSLGPKGFRLFTKAFLLVNGVEGKLAQFHNAATVQLLDPALDGLDTLWTIALEVGCCVGACVGACMGLRAWVHVCGCMCVGACMGAGVGACMGACMGACAGAWGVGPLVCWCSSVAWTSVAHTHGKCCGGGQVSFRICARCASVFSGVQLGCRQRGCWLPDGRLCGDRATCPVLQA